MHIKTRYRVQEILNYSLLVLEYGMFFILFRTFFFNYYQTNSYTLGQVQLSCFYYIILSYVKLQHMHSFIIIFFNKNDIHYNLQYRLYI